VNEAHIRSDLQRVNNEAGRQKTKAACYLYLFTAPYFPAAKRAARLAQPKEANSGRGGRL
jgi:hypothetical protein